MSIFEHSWGRLNCWVTPEIVSLAWVFQGGPRLSRTTPRAGNLYLAIHAKSRFDRSMEKGCQVTIFAFGA